MASESPRTLGLLKFGQDFELDLRSYELRRAGRPLKLERIPMELLLLLVDQRGQLVTRDQIVQKVWGTDVFLDTDNSINAAIRKIRQVLKDDSEQPHFVQTITGRGYRFIAPVIEVGLVEPAPSSPAQGTEALLGKKVSQYRVLQVLGGGGMGVVYKAEDLKLGRAVALKFLPSEMASDPKAFARFEREARAASALDHPNICPIYQLGEYEGQPFMVMPLLAGKTLREWIDSAPRTNNPPRVQQLLDIAIQIADGLEAAHQKGIVHRDIKPANVFITDRGEAKILDFGVAKFLEAQDPPAGDAAVSTQETGPASLNPTLTRTGISVGTPFYLSPEQVRGESLDARTDLFSFGLVLHELATGRRAFDGNTATVIRDAVENAPAIPVRQLDPSLPAGLEKIINKVLEKDREKRYQSARELKSDLTQLRTQLTTTRVSPGKVGAWLAAGAAVVGVGLFALNVGGVRERVFHPVQHAETTPAIKVRPSLAILGFKNLSGQVDQAWVSTALAEMLGAELAAGQQLRVVPSESVARMRLDLSLPPAESYSPDTLKKIHNHLSSDMVVLGSYLAMGPSSGGKVRIDLQLQDTQNGETIAVVSQDGPESDLAELVSRGGATLRQKLGIGDVSASDAPVIRAVIPTNPEAARLYAEGLQKLQTFDALGARDLLQKAIAADPNHALSHSALAESWSALGYDAKAQEEAKKSFDLSASLSREDRLSIEARYRQLSHEAPASIEMYQTLFNFFPDSLDYGLKLASAQIGGDKAKDALGTIARLRTLPGDEANDPRIDVTEAKTHEQLGDYKHEQQVAAVGGVKAQNRGALLILASARLDEGFALDHLGDPQKATAAITEARNLTQVKNPRMAALADLYIGHVLFDRGDFDSAGQSYERALQTYREVGDQLGMAHAQEALGNVSYEHGKFQEAKKYYEEELRINREIGRKQGVASGLGGLGNLLEEMGDLVGAAHANEESSKVFHELGNKRGEATSDGNWAIVLAEQGHLPTAIKKLEEMRALDEQIGYKRGIGFSLFTTATILRWQDRLDEAHKTAEQCISLRKELSDESNGARSQTLLAHILLDQNRPGEAEPLAKSALEQSAKLKIVDNEAESSAILADVALTQGRTKDAQAAADHAVSVSQKADRSARFESYLASVDVNLASGKFVEASKALETMRAETTHEGSLIYGLESGLRMGRLELKSGKTAAGRARLEKLEQQARSSGFLLIARKATAELKGNSGKN